MNPANQVVGAIQRRGSEYLRSAISGDQGLTPDEVADPSDPGLFGPGSAAWRVHGDAAMLIGGLRALLLQTLHPLAMAGVYEHSDYRDDPWGRLHRTGRFVGATTFGKTSVAEQQIAMVNRVHERVVGTAPDGRAYSANDPHLLLWVHVTEVDSFLTAFERHGYGKLTDAERDSYVNEMAEVALRLGSDEPPRSAAELADTIDAFRPECSSGPQVRETMRFLLYPPVPLASRGPYGIIAAGAVAALPPWARSMLRLPPLLPGADALAIRPAADALTKTMGWMMQPWQDDRRADDQRTTA